jgi:hypothetical protein
MTTDERREALRARWEAICTGSQRFSDGAWSPVQSEGFRKLNEALQSLGARLAGGELSPDQAARLEELVYQLADMIRDRLVDFALDPGPAQDGGMPPDAQRDGKEGDRPA